MAVLKPCPFCGRLPPIYAVNCMTGRKDDYVSFEKEGADNEP